MKESFLVAADKGVDVVARQIVEARKQLKDFDVALGRIDGERCAFLTPDGVTGPAGVSSVFLRHRVHAARYRRKAFACKRPPCTMLGQNGAWRAMAANENIFALPRLRRLAGIVCFIARWWRGSLFDRWISRRCGLRPTTQLAFPSAFPFAWAHRLLACGATIRFSGRNLDEVVFLGNPPVILHHAVTQLLPFEHRKPLLSRQGGLHHADGNRCLGVVADVCCELPLVERFKELFRRT